MDRTVILIPTYNERENIVLLLGEIFELHPDISVMVIDDNSPDGTGASVRALTQRYPNLSLFMRERKEGLGAAYKAGMIHALKDPNITHVITMDADGSHAAEYIGAMRAAHADYDLVIGSRYVRNGGIENWEMWRYFLSKFGNIYARVITGLPTRDMTAGFMSIRADLLRHVDFSLTHAAGYAFLMDLKFSLIHTLGARVVEVPITFKSRREGESKISGNIIMEGLKTPWRLFRRRLVARVGRIKAPFQNIPHESIACPLCKTGKTKVFCEKNGYQIYVCAACRLKFVYPVPDATAIYSRDYFFGATGGFGYTDYDRDKEPMVPAFTEYLRRIEMLLPERGPLLDVGAATGFFLSLATRRGFEPHGVEISSYAAERAREKGIAVITGTIADLPAEERFKVVTMLDVIEHVADPRSEIIRVHKLIAPKGLLVINTPDAGSLYARVMGKRWHLLVPPEHLYYFNRANMRSLLSKTGFDVITISTIGKKFTLPYIFKTLHAWQNFLLWKYLADFCSSGFLARISIPINLRDNMFVIARKL
jgi:dolichol-phosphate mannosyltransferase